MLNQAQIKFLRKQGHALKPYIWIGQNGLTKNVLAEIEQALSAHELVKMSVKVGGRAEKQTVVDQVSEQMDAECIQLVGNIALFFRKNPRKSKIELPV